MSLMTKMRENMAGIFAVFAVLFILYIIFDWGMDITGRKSHERSNVIGKINGKRIHYKEFTDFVKSLSENQKRQTGKDVDEESSSQIREEAWNVLVNQVLIEQEMDRLGITVTDQEIVDWVRGDNPPEFLVKQFIDSTGAFNRTAYDQAINDPRNRGQWIQIENVLKQQHMREKLQSILFATLRATEGEIFDRFTEQNTHLNVDFVLFEPNRLVKDSEVEVTDADIKKYYNENQDEFKQQATRKLRYVLFNETPSHQDSVDVLNELDDIVQKAKAGADFLDLLKTYSEIPFSNAFFKHGELSTAKETAVFSAKKNDLIGPLQDFDGYHVIKILADSTGKEEALRASHILLQFTPGVDTNNIWRKAKEIFQKAKRGENFATLAHTYSEDGSASRGGDLGWFGKGRMVKPFEDAAFKARMGEIVGPVRSQFGLHIIKVTGRDQRQVKIADILLSIKPSSQTKNEISQKASDFAYLASHGDFDKEAALSKYQVQETPSFIKGGVVPGVGYSDQVMRFAFNGKLGDVSDPIRLTNGLDIIKITEVKTEGVRPLQDVKESIKFRAQLKKKMEKVGQYAKQLRSKLSPTDSFGVLTKLDSILTVRNTGSFTPSQPIPIVGRDPHFLGNTLALPVREVSKPFEGVKGYYIIKVVSRSAFDSTAYQSQRNSIRDQVLQEKKSRYLNDWLAQLKEKADIVDDREKFFR